MFRRRFSRRAFSGFPCGFAIPALSVFRPGPWPFPEFQLISGATLFLRNSNKFFPTMRKPAEPNSANIRVRFFSKPPNTGSSRNPAGSSPPQARVPPQRTHCGRLSARRRPTETLYTSPPAGLCGTSPSTAFRRRHGFPEAAGTSATGSRGRWKRMRLVRSEAARENAGSTAPPAGGEAIQKGNLKGTGSCSDGGRAKRSRSERRFAPAAAHAEDPGVGRETTRSCGGRACSRRYAHSDGQRPPPQIQAVFERVPRSGDRHIRTTARAGSVLPVPRATPTLELVPPPQRRDEAYVMAKRG